MFTKHLNKTRVYGIVGFAAGYYVGRRYDLVVTFKKVMD